MVVTLEDVGEREDVVGQCVGWCSSKECPVHESLYIRSDWCRFHAGDGEVLLVWEELECPHVECGEVTDSEVGEVYRDESEGLVGCADV